jgi:predicted secreted protein
MKARRLVALMVFVLAASGCGTSEESSLFTDRDDRFSVDVGEEIQVVLESNVTTGYGWQLEAPLDGAVLELVGDRYEAPDTDLVGAAGRQVFDFRAVGDGSTFIQLWYVRPFDDPPDPADRAQFEVIVGTGVPDQTVDPADTDAPIDSPLDDVDALSLTELIDRGEVADVVVRTLLFDDGSGLVMCESLAESFPPQCVGARVPITNPEVVDADYTRQGEIRWTDRLVLLDGTLADGSFTVATR